MYGLTVTPSGLAGVSRVATRARVGRNARGTVRMMTPTVTLIVTMIMPTMMMLTTMLLTMMNTNGND